MASDFLRDSAYKAGEFERLQQQFDLAVFELTQHLVEPVERAMRAAMAQDIASTLADRAVAVERFLRGDDATPDAGDAAALQTEVALLRQELGREGLTLQLDEHAVAQEVQTCAAELAHHTLALWFGALRRARVSGGAVALNANMLPGEMSMQQALDALDVDAFGVESRTVLMALSRYRAALRARAVRDHAAIVFADDLVVAVGRGDALRPYTLYSSRQDQERAAAGAASFPAQPPVHKVRAQLLALARRIDQTISAHTAPSEQYERLIDAALQGPGVNRLHIGDVRVTLPSAMAAAAAGPMAARAVADDLFAYPIEAGADLIGAGAVEQWNEQLPSLASQLNDYSQIRRIPFETVSTAYSVLVAARCQPMTIDVQMWNQAHEEGGLVVQEQFARALDLSVDASATLLNDAAAGLGDGPGEGGVAGSFTGR